MKALLFGLFSGVLGSAFRKILLGAGIGLASAAFMKTIITIYINRAISTTNAIDGSYLGLVALSGVDVAISILIGALIARATIASMQVGLRKAAS